MKNKNAKYYQNIGDHRGALKIKNKWIGVINLNRINKSNLIRWQGPPSIAIEKSMKEKLLNAEELLN